MFPTKDQNAEILWEGFNNLFVDIECIDYSWIFDYRVSSILNNRARKSRFWYYAKAKRMRPEQKQNII